MKVPCNIGFFDTGHCCWTLNSEDFPFSLLSYWGGRNIIPNIVGGFFDLLHVLRYLVLFETVKNNASVSLWCLHGQKMLLLVRFCVSCISLNPSVSLHNFFYLPCIHQSTASSRGDHLPPRNWCQNRLLPITVTEAIMKSLSVLLCGMKDDMIVEETVWSVACFFFPVTKITYAVDLHIHVFSF